MQRSVTDRFVASGSTSDGFAGDNHRRANAEEEVRVGHSSQQLEPRKVRGSFFRIKVVSALTGGDRAVLVIQAHRSRRAETGRVIVIELGPPGQMIGHHDGTGHHDEQRRRDEQQANSSKRITVSHDVSPNPRTFNIAGASYRVVNTAKAWRFLDANHIRTEFCENYTRGVNGLIGGGGFARFQGLPRQGVVDAVV